jgi:hypothetical protein
MRKALLMQLILLELIILIKVKIMAISLRCFLHSPTTSSLSGPIFSSAPYSQTLSNILCTFLSGRNQVPRPHKTTCKTIVSYAASSGHF